MGMEDNKQMMELMTQLKEQSRKQTRYARLQCLFSLIAALCCVGIFLMVRNFLPEVRSLLVQLPGMLSQMQQVLSNMEQVTAELAAVDFGATVNGGNGSERPAGYGEQAQYHRL